MGSVNLWMKQGFRRISEPIQSGSYSINFEYSLCKQLFVSGTVEHKITHLLKGLVLEGAFAIYIYIGDQVEEIISKSGSGLGYWV